MMNRRRDRIHLGFEGGARCLRGGAEAATLDEAIARVNSLLCADNEATMFATVFFGVLDLRVSGGAVAGFQDRKSGV